MSTLLGHFRRQLVPLLLGIIHFDTETPDRAFALGMPEQKLDCPEIVCPPVDQSSFCPSQ